MSRIRILGASLIALTAGVGAAAAADIPQETYTPTPDITYNPEPVFSWSGFYAGGMVGYGWGDADVETESFDADGVTAGVYGGYNFEVSPNVILGVEADVSYKDFEESNATASFENNWNGTLRGRAGFAYDRFLFYGTGGLAVGDVDADGPAGSGSETRTGWTAGVGMETALTDNVIGRLEYRYTDLGSDTIGGNDVDFTSNEVMVGVGFKF